ncbi:hypothetical protein ACFPK8_04570, partial [Brachybacterium tyrofermentans]
RPRPHPAGTRNHRKLAIESGNQAIGQVKLSPKRAAVLPQIQRVLRINEIDTITNDVIEAAQSTLVIGVT